MKYGLWFLIFVAICWTSSGSEFGGKDNAGPKIEKKDGVVYVTNSGTPQKGTVQYKLQELLTIESEQEGSYLIAKPRELAISKDGRFFLLDYAPRHIKVFNNAGEYLHSIARKGDGPGELRRPVDFELDSKGQMLHILDGGNNKIIRYQTDGKLVSELRLPYSSPGGFFIDSDGLYNVFYSAWEDNRKSYYKVTRISRDGDALISSRQFFATQLNIVKRGEGSLVLPTPFAPNCHFTVTSRKFLYYGHSANYEFFLYNPAFQLARVIHKKDPHPVTLSEADVADAKGLYKRLERRRGIKIGRDAIRIPKHYPVFSDIWLDNHDRLWVKKPTRDQTVRIDLFDENGAYIEEMLFLDAPNKISLDSIFRRCVIKDDFIFTVATDEDDLRLIKKYRFKSTLPGTGKVKARPN